ncbi:unnamed protein product, partial [Amoebophrya sp. A25]
DEVALCTKQPSLSGETDQEFRFFLAQLVDDYNHNTELYCEHCNQFFPAACLTKKHEIHCLDNPGRKHLESDYCKHCGDCFFPLNHQNYGGNKKWLACQKAHLSVCPKNPHAAQMVQEQDMKLQRKMA